MCCLKTASKAGPAKSSLPKRRPATLVLGAKYRFTYVSRVHNLRFLEFLSCYLS